MNAAKFSRLKSILNSCFYNGNWGTFKILCDLFFIKINLKKKLFFKKDHAPFILRNGSSDIPVFRQIFMDYQYDFVMPTVKRYRTIIDGGSNHRIGESIFFASKYPDAKIIGHKEPQ